MESCRVKVQKPLRNLQGNKGRVVTLSAIFCLTGSAIQSAVAKWNLTSALEFTVDERREHWSLRLGKVRHLRDQ